MSTTVRNTKSHWQKSTCRKDGNWEVKKPTVQVFNNTYGVELTVFIITAPNTLLTEDSKMVSGDFVDHCIAHNLEMLEFQKSVILNSLQNLGEKY
jgi:hypothetical protein